MGEIWTYSAVYTSQASGLREVAKLRYTSTHLNGYPRARETLAGSSSQFSLLRRQSTIKQSFGLCPPCKQHSVLYNSLKRVSYLLDPLGVYPFLSTKGEDVAPSHSAEVLSPLLWENLYSFFLSFLNSFLVLRLCIPKICKSDHLDLQKCIPKFAFVIT